MKTYFLNNAFWQNDEHTSATAIFVTEFDSGSKENRQVDLDEILPNGQKCTMFAELIAQLGEEQITQSTEREVFDSCVKCVNHVLIFLTLVIVS